MKRLIINSAIIYSLILFGCAENSKVAKMEMADEEINTSNPDNEINQGIDRKLIKEGQIEFETSDISLTRKNVLGLVNKNKGYISSDQEFKLTDRVSNTIVVRIPFNNFDSLLNDVTKGIEKLDRKEIFVKDVTEEFLDIQARLKTKKELEIRYLNLLKQAKNVTEILEIEKQVGELRTDIESIEGRLNYLQNRVSLSTLTFTFYEVIPHQTEFGIKFKNGFKNGWDNFIWFFVALINVWPFIIAVLLIILGLKYFKLKK